ncbi:MAG TPA: hypothetical protein VIN61_09810 [Gammaproteobacteria bacterium]
MNPFEFVLAIIILAFSFKLLESWIKHRQQSRSAEGEIELLKRLDAIEERVKVLERIVTDERFDLRREFKNLGA